MLEIKTLQVGANLNPPTFYPRETRHVWAYLLLSAGILLNIRPSTKRYKQFLYFLTTIDFVIVVFRIYIHLLKTFGSSWLYDVIMHVISSCARLYQCLGHLGCLSCCTTNAVLNVLKCKQIFKTFWNVNRCSKRFEMNPSPSHNIQLSNCKVAFVLKVGKIPS